MFLLSYRCLSCRSWGFRLLDAGIQETSHLPNTSFGSPCCRSTTGQTAVSRCSPLPSSTHRKGTRHFLVSDGLRLHSSPTESFWADPCRRHPHRRPSSLAPFCTSWLAGATLEDRNYNSLPHVKSFVSRRSFKMILGSH